MEYTNQQFSPTTRSEITTNPEISILLATLRPENARKCLDSISERSEGVDYEVVVVSPLDMCSLLAGCKNYNRLQFVKEEKKEGCNKAFTVGYEHAAGKYIFAIADDHRLGQDCLKNLIAFMQPHDDEIFLAGARCYGVYGAGPEHKTYGFYYAYTPCIRRSLVESIGGFYDPYYKSYYGDPDLSMRVWHNGGKVELCLDAWVEYHNELDEVDHEAHTNYAARDFLAFFQRWQPIYGHLAKSSREEDINICNDYVLSGIPPEKCTRLVIFLRQKDWSSLGNELKNKTHIPLTQDYLFPVFKEMRTCMPFAPIDIMRDLSKWLIKQLFTQTSFRDAALKGEPNYNPPVFENLPDEICLKILFYFKSKDWAGIEHLLDTINKNEFILKHHVGNIYKEILKNINLLPPALTLKLLQWLFDQFAISSFSAQNPTNKKDDIRMAVFGYRGYNIVHFKGLYFGWPWSAGEFSIAEYMRGTVPEAVVEKSIMLVKDLINKKLGPPTLKEECSHDWMAEQTIETMMTDNNAENTKDDIRLAVFGYRGYNIVHCKKLYFGWPWSAGEFSWDKYLSRTIHAAVVGISIINVKKVIDAKLGPPTVEEENQHDWITLQQIEDQNKTLN